MRPLISLALLACGGIALLSGCPTRAANPEHPVGSPTTTSPSKGLVLQSSEGERRVRRARPNATLSTLTAPFIIKVDPRSGGSPDLVMGYEDIPPGQAISPHHHPLADEILFVHRGSGVASLGTRSASVTAGATIYLPRNTPVSLRNTGTEPLGIAFIFSRPGFEEYLREVSVPEGERAEPLSVEELSRIRARHGEHVVFEQP